MTKPNEFGWETIKNIIILLFLWVLIRLLVTKFSEFIKSLSSDVEKIDTFVNGVYYPVSYWSEKGCRPYQEDRHCEQKGIGGNDSSIFAIFDGHGGDRASQYCKDTLIKHLLADDQFGTDTAAALKRAFHLTNNEFSSLARSQSLTDGTTALVAVVHNGRITVANAGDCRCVLVQRGARARGMSSDHKPDREDEQLRIRKLGGRVIHSGRWRVQGVLAVSRAIGDVSLQPYVTCDPEICEREISPGEDWFLVMASDGVWDVLSNKRVAEFVCQAMAGAGIRGAGRGGGGAGGGIFSLLARDLCSEAILLGSQDNVTALVVDLRPGARDREIQRLKRRGRARAASLPRGLIAEGERGVGEVKVIGKEGEEEEETEEEEEEEEDDSNEESEEGGEEEQERGVGEGLGSDRGVSPEVSHSNSNVQQGSSPRSPSKKKKLMNNNNNKTSSISTPSVPSSSPSNLSHATSTSTSSFSSSSSSSFQWMNTDTFLSSLSSFSSLLGMDLDVEDLQQGLERLRWIPSRVGGRELNGGKGQGHLNNDDDDDDDEGEEEEKARQRQEKQRAAWRELLMAERALKGEVGEIEEDEEDRKNSLLLNPPEPSPSSTPSLPSSSTSSSTAHTSSWAIRRTKPTAPTPSPASAPSTSSSSTSPPPPPTGSASSLLGPGGLGRGLLIRKLGNAISHQIHKGERGKEKENPKVKEKRNERERTGSGSGSDESVGEGGRGGQKKGGRGFGLVGGLRRRLGSGSATTTEKDFKQTKYMTNQIVMEEKEEEHQPNEIDREMEDYMATIGIRNSFSEIISPSSSCHPIK